MSIRGTSAAFGTVCVVSVSELTMEYVQKKGRKREKSTINAMITWSNRLNSFSIVNQVITMHHTNFCELTDLCLEITALCKVTQLTSEQFFVFFFKFLFLKLKHTNRS